jgi:hypothetical protein
VLSWLTAAAGDAEKIAIVVKETVMASASKGVRFINRLFIFVLLVRSVA